MMNQIALKIAAQEIKAATGFDFASIQHGMIILAKRLQNESVNEIIEAMQ